MKALTLGDTIIPFIYSSQVRGRFENVDLVIGCGDLAYDYLNFVVDMLNVPLFFVRGNHDRAIDYNFEMQPIVPGFDLHSRTTVYRGLLLAGVEGCTRYRPGLFQYTPSEMWEHVFHLLPGLFYNRLKYGRFLDIFVTHAPPAGIHDDIDLPHQGIKAFRWLLQVFRPAYHFHGHVHIHRPDIAWETTFGATRVINTYGFREVTIPLNDR